MQQPSRKSLEEDVAEMEIFMEIGWPEFDLNFERLNALYRLHLYKLECPQSLQNFKNFASFRRLACSKMWFLSIHYKKIDK